MVICRFALTLGPHGLRFIADANMPEELDKEIAVIKALKELSGIVLDGGGGCFQRSPDSPDNPDGPQMVSFLPGDINLERFSWS